MYKVTIKRSAAKEIKKLSKSIATRILRSIKALEEYPRPLGVKKLQGEDELWRIRVGDYRVIYTIEDIIKIIDVVHVSHRKDAYRKK